MKVRLTVRQLNSALSGLQAAKQLPETRESLRDLIQTMIEKKLGYVELEGKDKFCEAIIKLAGLNEQLVGSQKRNMVVSRHRG